MTVNNLADSSKQKFCFFFGTIMNSAEFDVLNFQSKLLYKVNKWGKMVLPRIDFRARRMSDL